jgi:twitching motility protein PilT
VSGIKQLLPYLQRDDVRELVLQTDSPPAVRVGEQLRALGKQPLSTAQIEALVAGTAFSQLVPQTDNVGATESATVDGEAYVARVARKGDKLQIRLARSPSKPKAAPEPAPAGSGIELDMDDGGPPRSMRGAARDEPRPVEPLIRSSEPMSRSLSGLLKTARGQGASDVHVMSERPPQVRIAGQLHPRGAAISHAEAQGMLLPLLDERGTAALAQAGYTDLALDLPGAGRMRLNVSRQKTGIKGCFRLVAAEPPSLAQLGLPEELSKITLHHQGLVIISGPSGHGKTTTMAALVNLFNETRPVHIITVEDPVEVIHPVKRAIVSQREIGRHTASAHTALKAALREDPDVIAIGELRDRETVEMALSASETGHLVLATMSTPSGARTIDRLIDMFPPDDQAQVRATLAGGLKMIISQRLLPNIDGTRMVAASELITGNIPLWSLIRENKLYQLPSLLQRGRAYGMIRIDDSLNALLRRGDVTEAVAKSFADDPKMVGTAPQAQQAEAASGAQPPPGTSGLLSRFGKKA